MQKWCALEKGPWNYACMKNLYPITWIGKAKQKIKLLDHKSYESLKLGIYVPACPCLITYYLSSSSAGIIIVPKSSHSTI